MHYQNPKLIVGCVPEHEGRILLCRRAIEPRLGFWTIPAGFMENGETTQDGARRESLEEAQARGRDRLAAGRGARAARRPGARDVPRAPAASREFGAGAESLEVRLCDEAEIPWDDIAFRSVDFALRRYFEDRRLGVEDHHFTALDLASAAR